MAGYGRDGASDVWLWQGAPCTAEERSHGRLSTVHRMGVKTDGEDCAKEWLKRCVEQALHEELKVNDIQSGSRPPKQYYSSGVDVADMIRVTGAVSAKMAAERGIKRVPLAVLSQSEVTRRMKTI